MTGEMEVLIAAAAVQLTMGLETWDLSYFPQVLIYPAEYQNPLTKNYHKGETNLGGFMCFSWKHFLEGNASDNDKINLGLHEFAHALRFNGIRGNQSDYFFENYFPRWAAVAAKEFNQLRNNSPSIFRKYGGVNLNEFFSVVVETFFETPELFREQQPELYTHTAILLNQITTPEGHIALDCREELLDDVSEHLSRPSWDAFHFNLQYNASLLFAVGFFIIGAFSLYGEGYKYPPPYICFFIAALSWLNVERRYTRLRFSERGFNVQKGFFLLRGYRSVTLPLSKLISLVGSHRENEHGIRTSIVTATYYKKGSFYEDDLTCILRQPAFDQLTGELRKNGIHIFITDES